MLSLGPDTSGQRFLHCSLCATQWHRVRITCTNCGNSAGIDYQQLHPADAAPDSQPPTATVQAECCPACHSYLKLVALDQDPHAEPVADDLASIALDVLLGDQGWQRHGLNFLLLMADPDPPPEPR